MTRVVLGQVLASHVAPRYQPDRPRREIAAEGGTTLTIGAGAFGRHGSDNGADGGPLFYVDGVHARAVDDRWAFKLSAGYLAQDPLPRPTGTIANPFQTPYPSFMNRGTSQPKFEGRVDYDMADGATVTVSGGVAGTEGIIHSGIGPFDISLAPAGDNRNEGGGFIQDEIFLGDHFRWVVGGRLDKFSSIGDAVFSPRTTFMMKPDAAQTFRVSFNRAFRAPSFINNHIDTTILNEIDLGALSPALKSFVFPIRAIGNPDLRQETMTAYEVGYIGVIRNRATVSAAVYRNVTEDGIYFTPNVFYTPAAAPRGLPPPLVGVLSSLSPPVLLPSQFTYLNLGTITDKGVEVAADATVNRYLNVFTNYSFQAKPVVKNLPPGTTINDINWPAKNRVDAGFDFSRSRFLGNLAVSYTGEAY